MIVAIINARIVEPIRCAPVFIVSKRVSKTLSKAIIPADIGFCKPTYVAAIIENKLAKEIRIVRCVKFNKNPPSKNKKNILNIQSNIQDSLLFTKQEKLGKTIRSHKIVP